MDASITFNNAETLAAGTASIHDAGWEQSSPADRRTSCARVKTKTAAPRGLAAFIGHKRS